MAGCLSQRYPDGIRAELPEADGLLGTGSYTQIFGAAQGYKRNIQAKKLLTFS